MAWMPKSRPGASREHVLELLKEKGVDASHQLVLIGVRGYYSTTYGRPGNDRAAFDDALFVIGPNVFRSFNFNCDPGAFRRGMANLKAGVWKYKPGIHGLSKPKFLRYRAFVQASKVTVKRDESITETGFFAINIHKGGMSTVSSLGCQTVPRQQWDEFFDLTMRALAGLNQSEIVYVLHESDLEGGI